MMTNFQEEHLALQEDHAALKAAHAEAQKRIEVLEKRAAEQQHRPTLVAELERTICELRALNQSQAEVIRDYQRAEQDRSCSLPGAEV